jgi:hypothetical protein
LEGTRAARESQLTCDLLVCCPLKCPEMTIS